MIVVGITGSLASGKSEVTGFFKKWGARVFDADKVAKTQTRKGTPVHGALTKLFGREFILKNGEIDRKKLALYVFSRPQELRKLNILIHPGVIFESIKVIQQSKGLRGILVLDVPLLFESKMQSLADVTIVVSASKEKITKRAKRKGIPGALAKKILATQWPFAKKGSLADFVIENNGSLEDLKKKAKEVFLKITKNGGN